MSVGADFVTDENILWKCLDKIGTPEKWEPSKTYVTGDLVVPRVVQTGQERIMFQCLGYIGKSHSTSPTFPSVLNTFQEDNNIVWKTRLPTKDPEALKENEFYLITETVTLV